MNTNKEEMNTTETVTVDCIRCDGYGRNEWTAPCVLCETTGRVTVTIPAGLDKDGPWQDATVDAMWNREIELGLRAPDVNKETADFFNNEVK